MRFILSALIIAFSATICLAQDSLAVIPIDSTYIPANYEAKDAVAPHDSSFVEARSFNQAKVEDLKNDDDFDYKQPPTVAESLWDRFLYWIGRLFSWMFRAAETTNWGRVVVIALGIFLVAGVVMMLLKVDAFRVLFSGADKTTLSFDTLQENIHEMNFDVLIKEALEKKEYRLAIRLTFLNALKLLSDKQHVDWRPGKTNHEYVDELKQADLKIGFNELSFYFDYAWYGEFKVNESMYERVRLIFDSWRTKVQ